MAYRYYDVQRNWRKIAPHLDDPVLNEVLREDFGKFLWGRWREEFEPGKYPLDYESCGWYLGHRGPMPRFWRYVKWSACFWVVNFNYLLACMAEPRRPWRIKLSDKHATVWDRHNTYFDMNFLALGVTPFECHTLATVDGIELDEFELHWPSYPAYYLFEDKGIGNDCTTERPPAVAA
jgi:hypothetical protein